MRPLRTHLNFCFDQDISNVDANVKGSRLQWHHKDFRLYQWSWLTDESFIFMSK